MNLARSQLDAIVHALAAVLPARAPADTQLRQFFRDNKNLGHRDRALVADTVYAALRRRRLLEHVTPGATPREMALATIVKLQGVGLGQIESVLKGSEKTWLAELKGRDIDVQGDVDDPEAGVGRAQGRGDVEHHRVVGHAAASGQAILAFLGQEQQEDVIALGLEGFSETTVTDPDALRAELTRIRERGYSINMSGYRPDVVGFGAAVLDRARRPLGVTFHSALTSLSRSRRCRAG